MLFATSSRARFGEENGDIPQFLANGVRPHARSQVFERRVRGLTPFARCAGNWGMSPFSSPAFARRKPTGLNICKIGDRIGTTAARTGFLLAALHSVAKRFSRRPAYHPTQPVPAH